MAIVFGFGFSMGLGLPALDVWREQDYHAHVWIERCDDSIEVDWTEKSKLTFRTNADANFVSPFWPRYWRRLGGLPWKMQPVCQLEIQQVEMICEYHRPEICRRGRYRINSVHVPVSMQISAIRMNRKSLGE